MFSNNKWMGNIYEMKYLFMYKATGEGNNQQEENEWRMKHSAALVLL